MFEEEAVKHYNNLTKSALRLNEIVKKQQQRINRAIEYIEPFVDIDMCTINGRMLKPLLEILKGVQDERTINI